MPSRFSAEEEAALVAAQDIRSRNRLIEAHMGLVQAIARRFSRGGEDHQDLVQEGVFGLIRAYELYDPAKGSRFATYASFWIEAKVRRMRFRGSEETNPVLGAVQALDRRPDGRLNRPRARTTSLDAPRGLEDAGTVGESVASDEPTPEVVVAENNRAVAVRDTLRRLAAATGDWRCEVIVELRLLSDDPNTLGELGTTLGVSREWVRQLEARLLAAAKAELETP